MLFEMSRIAHHVIPCEAYSLYNENKLSYLNSSVLERIPNRPDVSNSKQLKVSFGSVSTNVFVKINFNLCHWNGGYCNFFFPSAAPFPNGTPLGLVLLKTSESEGKEKAKGMVRKNFGFIFVYNFNISFVLTQRARSFLSFECFISFLSQNRFFFLIFVLCRSKVFFIFFHPLSLFFSYKIPFLQVHYADKYSLSFSR